MQTALIAANVVLAVIMLIGIGYIRGLPRRLHEEGLRHLDHRLNRDLEEARAAWTRDLEIHKISAAELQVHKVEQLVKLAEFFNAVMTNPRKFANIEKDAKKQQALKNEMFDMGVKLFYFTSDETIEAFNAWRSHGLTQEPDGFTSLQLYAELMVRIRRDVGYADTAVTWEDFLRVVLTDWDQFKERRAAQSSRAG